MNDVEGSKADFLESIKLNPTDTQSLVKVASVYMEQSDPKKAFECFDNAIKINPNDPDIYYHRGQGEHSPTFTRVNTLRANLFLCFSCVRATLRYSSLHNGPIHRSGAKLHQIDRIGRFVRVQPHSAGGSAVQGGERGEQHGDVQEDLEGVPGQKRAL
jgi:tetratricopeptide (TPR) repeat protein